MKQKLNCILLIDDDEDDNFIHQMVIRKADVAHKIVIRENGLDALEYLQTLENGKYPQPDLIFLDINMPRMNGWEFLAEYQKLESVQQGKVMVVMLTTSLNPNDENRAKSNPYINKFLTKPLTRDRLLEIIDQRFEH
ncbi:MAG: response regulator [Bacteroidia bacterium]